MIRRHFLAGIVGIKAMCAAAALAIGAGQAEAATYTTVNYDLYLRYEGSVFTDFTAIDLASGREYSSPGYPIEDPLGLNVPNKKFPSVAVGDIVRFIATVIFPDDPNEVVGQYGNGGSAPFCSVAGVSCVNTEYTRRTGPYGFDLKYSDQFAISGNAQVGSAFTYSHYYTGDWFSNDGRMWYYAWDSQAVFTVVDTPAPVPLPATAALLPLGIGALALMRRRRRQVS